MFITRSCANCESECCTAAANKVSYKMPNPEILVQFLAVAAALGPTFRVCDLVKRGINLSEQDLPMYLTYLWNHGLLQGAGVADNIGLDADSQIPPVRLRLTLDGRAVAKSLQFAP